ncbi:MAG: putative ABC transporter permease [Oscillospiraceae bacterium]
MNTFLIIAFLFFAGCIIGWLLELVYRRFAPENKEKKWINPGFLVGPYLPLYGFGLCVLYLLAGLERFIHFNDPVMQKLVLFIIMAVAMTVLEYIAGEIFIVHMHVKLWDYSARWGNVKGIICPLFSLFWAILGAIYYFLIHPYILHALDWFSRNLVFSFVIGFFYGVFCIDVCYSFQIAAKIRKFASENDMVIRYEEFKRHIRATAEEKKEKYRFMLAMATETSLSEHLAKYLEKQREQEKLQKLNDFIEKKIRKK